MNDELEETLLETELRALQPTASSERLENRIASQLTGIGAAMHCPRWWQRLGFARPAAAMTWGLAAPAATVAITLIIVHVDDRRLAPSPPIIQANRAEHISPVSDSQAARAANVVYAAVDEGIVPNGGQGPMRRVRYHSTDHVQWRNPRTGAEWEVSYPREDVLLVPINAD